MLIANDLPLQRFKKFIDIFNIIIPYHSARRYRMIVLKAETEMLRQKIKTI